MAVHYTEIENLLDLEYCRDLAPLQIAFAQVHTGDPHSLRTWFEAHPYLTYHDMCRIANVHRYTVYRWYKLAGCRPQELASSKPRRSRPPVPTAPRRAPEIPVAPSDWTTAWLVEKYQEGHGLRQLAKSVRRSVKRVRERLMKVIKLRDKVESVRTTHPCYTLTWVFEHYVQRKLSQTKCAQLAGITRNRFSFWLAHFKIRIRSTTEQRLIDYDSDLGKVARLCP